MKAVTVKGFYYLVQSFLKVGLTLNDLQLLIRWNKLFLWFIITIKLNAVISVFGLVAIKIRLWRSSPTQNNLSLVTTAFYFFR